MRSRDVEDAVNLDSLYGKKIPFLFRPCMFVTFACSQIWGKAITRDVLLVITNSFAQETFIFLNFAFFCKSILVQIFQIINKTGAKTELLNNYLIQTVIVKLPTDIQDVLIAKICGAQHFCWFHFLPIFDKDLDCLITCDVC